jgi:hypothetical protein
MRLLKNRAIQISLAKPVPKDGEPLPASLDVQDYLPIVRALGMDIGKGVAILMAGYIALDTMRQVIVTVVDNKTS